MDGITAIVAILLASFAIDRIVTGLIFLLGLIKPWERLFPEPKLVEDKHLREKAERKRTLLYFTLAAILALVVLAGYGNVSILASVGFGSIRPWMDKLLTGLILIGGADRVAEILKMGPIGIRSTDSGPAEAIKVTGRLVLESREGQVSVKGAE